MDAKSLERSLWALMFACAALALPCEARQDQAARTAQKAERIEAKEAVDIGKTAKDDPARIEPDVEAKGESEWDFTWPTKEGADTLDGYRNAFTLGGRYGDHSWDAGETHGDLGLAIPERQDYFIGTVNKIETDPSWGVFGRIELIEAEREDWRLDISSGIQLSYDAWSFSWYEVKAGISGKEGDAEVSDFGYGIFVEGDWQPFEEIPASLEARLYLGLDSLSFSTDMNPVYSKDGTVWRDISMDSTTGTVFGYEVGVRVIEDIRLDFGQRMVFADTTVNFDRIETTTGQSTFHMDNNASLDSTFTYVALSYSFF